MCSLYIYLYIKKNWRWETQHERESNSWQRREVETKGKGGEENSREGSTTWGKKKGRKKERNRKEKWEKRASTVFPLRCAVSILTDLPYFSETNQDSGLFHSYPINYPLLDNHLSSSILFSFQHKCISFSLFFFFFSCCLIRLNTCRRQSRLCGNLHLRYSVFKSPCPFMYPWAPRQMPGWDRGQ